MALHEKRKLTFLENLQNYIRARYALILIKTDEEGRLTSDLVKAVLLLNRQPQLDPKNYHIITWSISRGLKQSGAPIPATNNLQAAINKCEQLAKETKTTNKGYIFVFYDVVPHISEPNGLVNQRCLKEFALSIIENNYCCNCILVSNTSEVRGSIASEITVLDYPLLTREEIYNEVYKFAQSYQSRADEVDMSSATITALTDAALGLKASELSNCLSRALVEDKRLNIDDVAGILEEKKQIVRKSEILDYIDTSSSMDDVGGLNVLKSWLNKRAKTFSDEAKRFGLQAPKGVLLVGIPGCGKSLTAKCVAKTWNMPLLKLEMGKIFNKYVGDSEANIRRALKTAEAIAPCVLWIDEIEKGLATNNDSGTSTRVFGTILTWMQEKTSPVFTFATANKISSLPPELLRKGRFDEIFFVDLPDFEERKHILEIHIKKALGRNNEANIGDFDLDLLAKNSGEEYWGPDIRLSGSEIEAWVKDSLLEAFDRQDRHEGLYGLTMADFDVVLKRMVPMAKMQQSEFSKLREWANENAVSASVSSRTAVNNPNVSLGGRRLDLSL